MKKLTDDSLVARALGWLASAVIHHRGLFVWPQVVLLLICAAYTLKFLEFDTSRDNLVGPNKKYHQNFLKFKKEFPSQDDLAVVVESEDPEKNRQFVERLGSRLESETNLFRNVFYKGDLKMLGSKALLFVPATNLAELNKTLADYLPFIEQFTRTTNLNSLFAMVNTQFRTAKQERNAQTESLIKALPALGRIVTQATASLRRSGTPPSPGITALFDPSPDAEQQIYITFGGRIYLATAQAANQSQNAEAVERLRVLVDETKAEVPGLNVGLTGEPILELDEMAQSQKDTTVASIAALLICALIFIYGYQETGRPIKATLCLIVGLVYTLAYATLTVGHLNVLTITFVPILIGLAIDYGVHLISRYEEELRHGKTQEAALTKAMVFTGQGIFTGAFTTAGAFLAMSFTNFKGIQEMGVICGGGLLICLIPMMTILPALLLSGRQNRIDLEHGDVAERRARIENIWLKRPMCVAGITLGLCALAATQVHKVYFDYDLLNMQSEGLPAVEFEKKLIRANEEALSSTNSSAKSILFGAIVATNIEQAVELEKQIKELPAVAGVESMTKYLAEDQTRKLPMISEIKQRLSSIQFQPADPKPVDIEELSRTLYSFYGYLGAANDEVGKEDPTLSRELLSLRTEVGELRKAMYHGAPVRLGANSLKLASFQRALFNDVRDTFNALQHQDNSAPLEVRDLPQSMRDRFVGVTGKYLLMVYPKKNAWERENQKEFISELRAIDPNVTGTPVQLYEYTTLLKNSYEEAAWYSLGAIVVLIFLHFRGISSIILALIPVAIGSLWLGGIMGALNIPLNPANIMTLPLVIGIGVTNGIHILNRFAEEQTPSILARSTGKAVLVSGLTTIAGFGSLALGKHRGIESLGYVMATGLATCMVAGLTFLPALLNLMSATRAPKKQPSVDNARSTLGREEPR